MRFLWASIAAKTFNLPEQLEAGLLPHSDAKFTINLNTCERRSVRSSTYLIDAPEPGDRESRAKRWRPVRG